MRCAQIPVSLATAPFIAPGARGRACVHVWTVNDAEIMTGLLDLGVDGIMTDQTEPCKDVLPPAASGTRGRRIAG